MVDSGWNEADSLWDREKMLFMLGLVGEEL